MGKLIKEQTDGGYVERYFMSREDAERAKNSAKYQSIRDAAAQIISLMDEVASAVAAEREACAKIAEDKAAHYKAIEWYPAYGLDAFVVEDERIAAAIRARNGNGAKGE